jgi:hypothetical protein
MIGENALIVNHEQMCRIVEIGIKNGIFDYRNKDDKIIAIHQSHDKKDANFQIVIRGDQPKEK